MRFTNAYAACPVCSPTRASVLTGKYPARLHLTDFLTGRSDRPSQKLLRPKFRQYLSLDEVTIAKALKSQGYMSAAVGKWHLGGQQHDPIKHGFDVNIGGTETGSPPGGYFRFRTPTMTARNDPGVFDGSPHRRGGKVHRPEQRQALFPLPVPLCGPHSARGQEESARQVPGKSEARRSAEQSDLRSGGPERQTKASAEF